MTTVGRYEVLGPLGDSGRPVVHLARQTDAGRLVALKQLAEPGDRAVVARVLEVARLSSGLRHPNVVAVHELFEHQGTPYLAMEYVERGSIRPLMRALTVAQLAGVLEDVLAGVGHAGAHGIVHRDLKPENLLVSQEGRVKVGDFGISKAFAGDSDTGVTTPPGLALGTPTYMAPEQARGEQVGPWTDLYAIGCVAFEILVGQVPFAADSTMAILLRRVSEPAPVPHELEPKIDPTLSAWVARLLAPDPAQRPQTAAAAWQALEQVISGLLGPAWREAAGLPPPGPARTPPSVTCPQCGADNPPGDDFCSTCGEYLRWEPTDSVPVVAAEELPTPVVVPVPAWSAPVEAGPPPAPAPAASPEPGFGDSALPEDRPSQPLRRTPHMDFSLEPPLEPGTVFDVTVFADRERARALEDVDALVFVVPRHIEQIELDVWLVTTHHFVITDAATRRMTLDVGAPRSAEVCFRVAVVAAADAGEEPLITASFSYNGRPSGRVTRAVGIASASAPVRHPEAMPVFAVDVVAKAPDLTVEIAAPENDGRRFEVRVHTPLLDLGRTTETWFLPEEAPALVLDAMERFFDPDATARARMSTLRGAGLEFFDAAPQLFKEVYWRLVDEGRPPRNLFLISDERSIPWELMIPSRRTPAGQEEHAPLGVQLAVGRWHRGAGVSPRQRVRLGNSYVVAPEYTRSARLDHAAAEADFVCRNFRGSRIDPANFDNLDVELGRGGVDLLHFVCHGESDDREQILVLEEPDKLHARQIRAMPGLAAACRERKPFVFLNACEVGRPARGLVGASGFAKSFIDVDASCVVGTLWSVDDRTAHSVAMDFYEQILDDGRVPFAEALRRIRARGYETPGDDSSAAYCFYGDPAASLR